MFELLSNKYSLDFILLNIEHLQKEVCTITCEITDIAQKISSLMEKDAFEQYMEGLNVHLSKFQMESEEVKRSKWNRDTEDYRRGAIYIWHKEIRLRRNIKESNNNNKKRRRPPVSPTTQPSEVFFREHLQCTAHKKWRTR